MGYQITKVSHPCGHGFFVSVPNENQINVLVAEIRFHRVDANLDVVAGRAAHAMVAGMAPVWRLTPDGPIRPACDDTDPERRVNADGRTNAEERRYRRVMKMTLLEAINAGFMTVNEAATVVRRCD